MTSARSGPWKPFLLNTRQELLKALRAPQAQSQLFSSASAGQEEQQTQCE